MIVVEEVLSRSGDWRPVANTVLVCVRLCEWPVANTDLRVFGYVSGD